MLRPKQWLILITIILSILTTPHVSHFVQLAESYNVDPSLAAAIISCESDGLQQATHYDTGKYAGQTDVGVWQIANLHASEALKMGYDIYSYDGNLSYGFYLLAKEGTGPWTASQKCWSRKINPNFDMFGQDET